MGKHSKVSSSTEWRLRENVVLRPMNCLTPTVKFDIYNYFTFARLPTTFGVNNIRATVVLGNANSLSLGTNGYMKKERGHFEQRTSSKKVV